MLYNLVASKMKKTLHLKISKNPLRTLIITNKTKNPITYHNSRNNLTDVEKAVVNLLAAQRNDVNRLINSFLENQDLNGHNDYDGSTLLHVAAGHNSFD